jgi:hypothetical protein
MNTDKYALLWANGMNFHVVLEKYAHDLAELIREDRERQQATGQYDVGMRRAHFLITRKDDE